MLGNEIPSRMSLDHCVLYIRVGENCNPGKLNVGLNPTKYHVKTPINHFTIVEEFCSVFSYYMLASIPPNVSFIHLVLD